MVGSAIKKFANEVGLKLGGGVAYGVWGGYMLTLVDGMDIKKHPSPVQLQTMWLRS